MCAQARRERDHKARASSKPSKPKYGGSATGSFYKEKERQAVLAIKDAMQEKRRELSEAEEAAARAKAEEAAAKAKAQARQAANAEREKQALAEINAALKEKNEKKKVAGGGLQGKKPVTGLSGKSSAALGALLRQRVESSP